MGLEGSSLTKNLSRMTETVIELQFCNSLLGKKTLDSIYVNSKKENKTKQPTKQKKNQKI